MSLNTLLLVRDWWRNTISETILMFCLVLQMLFTQIFAGQIVSRLLRGMGLFLFIRLLFRL